MDENIIKCHQQHNIPWKLVLERPVRQRKNSEGSLDKDNGLIWSEQWLKDAQHFVHCFEKTLVEFAETESKKYDREKIKNLNKIYEDSEVSEILLKDFQYTEAWNREIKKFFQQKTHFMSFDGKLCSIVSELFNLDKMESLLLMAQKVKGIELFDWATYSNFFHYGYRRILDDALWWYIYSHYKIIKYNFKAPEKWGVHHFLFHSDFDVAARVYRETLGFNENREPSSEEVLESQKFAFKKLYQYHIFWEEVLHYSPGVWNTFDMASNPCTIETQPKNWKSLIYETLKDVILYERRQDIRSNSA